ncbi:MAG TPA: 50S ribosomal protein L23 [Planctomycetota bacterium]|nr:50S ribosomal protein L23 [Planctomycetota bacterium]
MRDPRQIVLRPLLNEKGEILKERVRAYPFEVAADATKVEIRKAIEQIFDNVKVVAVRTMMRRGKKRRLRYKTGHKRNWKRALVFVSPESMINI